jgi:hypothetical protein
VLVLDDKFRVSVDSSKQNFQLEMLQPIVDKKTREVVRHEFGIIGFHGNSMRSVLSQYVKQSLINDDKLENIDSVLDRLNEVEKTIIKVAKTGNFTLDVKNND